MNVLAIGSHPDDIEISCCGTVSKYVKRGDNIDFAEFMRVCSGFRGLQHGVGYAEGFTQELVWPKVVTRRLLP